MRRLDALVTTAETTCKRQAAEPRAAKLSVCRRALACIEPAKRAQHAVQDMLLVMAKMEDSADDRLAAGAAFAGALASCGVAGFVESRGSTAEAAKSAAASTMPQNAANAIVDRVVVEAPKPLEGPKPAIEIAPAPANAPSAPAAPTQPAAPAPPH